MKKILVLILSALMLTTALSACGAADNSKPSDSAPSQTISDSGESSEPAGSAPAEGDQHDETPSGDAQSDGNGSGQTADDDAMITLGNIEITEMPVALSVFENDGWTITEEKDDYGWYHLSKGESNIRCGLNEEQNDLLVYLDIYDTEMISDNELNLADSVQVLIFGTPINEVTGEFLIEKLGQPTRFDENDDSLNVTFGESTLDANKQALCYLNYVKPSNTLLLQLKDWDYYTALNN